jgi:hypothetical protein
VVVVNRTFARLYAPDTHDPAAFLGTKLLDLKQNASMRILMSASGLLAAYLPARQAAFVDPVEALRAE